MSYQCFLHMGQHCYVVRFAAKSLSSHSLDEFVFSGEDKKTEYADTAQRAWLGLSEANAESKAGD